MKMSASDGFTVAFSVLLSSMSFLACARTCAADPDPIDDRARKAVATVVGRDEDLHAVAAPKLDADVVVFGRTDSVNDARAGSCLAEIARKVKRRPVAAATTVLPVSWFGLLSGAEGGVEGLVQLAWPQGNARWALARSLAQFGSVLALGTRLNVPKDARIPPWEARADLLAVGVLDRWLQENRGGTCIVDCPIDAVAHASPLMKQMRGRGWTVTVVAAFDRDTSETSWLQGGGVYVMPMAKSVEQLPEASEWRPSPTPRFDASKFSAEPSPYGRLFGVYKQLSIRDALAPLKAVMKSVRAGQALASSADVVPADVLKAEIVVVAERHDRGYSASVAASVATVLTPADRPVALLLEAVPYDTQRLLDRLPGSVYWLLHGVWSFPAAQLSSAVQFARQRKVSILAGGSPHPIFARQTVADSERRLTDSAITLNARDDGWFTWTNVLMCARAASWLKVNAGGRVVILVGAAHVFSQTGLVERFQRAGRTVSVVLADVAPIEHALSKKFTAAQLSKKWIKLGGRVWRPPTSFASHHIRR